MDNGCHNIQNFGITGICNIALIIEKDCVEQRRNHIFIDHLQVVSFLNINVNELEYLLFDSAKAADLGGLCGNIS